MTLTPDEKAFGDITPGNPTENAKTVLRILQAGSLRHRLPDAAIPDAIALWATELAGFSAVVLERAARWWVQHQDEFPTLGEMIAVAEQVVADNAETERIATPGPCQTCDGTHWVTVVDKIEQVETWESKKRRQKNPDAEPEFTESRATHSAPCPHCPEMVERRELYDRGHFTMDHLDAGGCPKCWKYTPSLAHRARAAERGRK